MKTRRALALLACLLLPAVAHARTASAPMATIPQLACTSKGGIRLVDMSDSAMSEHDAARAHASSTMIFDDSPEKKALDAEQEHMPPYADLSKMDDADGHGHRVRVVYASVQMTNGVPTWHVGTANILCGGEPPTPALEARIRAEFAQYTSAPVVIEPGWLATSAVSPDGKRPVPPAGACSN
jgi:hypothetical protein